MAYNTRSIKTDVDGRPVPQYFNSTADDYEPLLGENGAARSVLYGPNGQPINSSNPLPTKDDALAALLGELNNAPVTDPSATSATVLQLLRGLLAVAGRETTLAAVKAAIDELTARAATEETLSATRDALDSLAQRGLATEVTLAQAAQALATLAGTVDAGAQQVTLSGQIEVLYEGPVSTITAGSSVALVPKRPTEFKEVRGGIAVTSATRGDWRLYVSHLHASVGNNFGSEDLVRLNDTVVGGSGAKNLLSSHFEVRVLNNNSFDAGVYRVSILGVR